MTLPIDVEAPTIGIVGAGTYTIDQIVRITCTASDSVSGVTYGTCASPLVDTPAYLLGPGTFIAAAHAEDIAGNVSSAEAEYTVEITLESLFKLLRQWITGPGSEGILNSFRHNLLNGNMDALTQEVHAQKGNKLREDQADKLLAWIEALK
ncbi:hypothetical protein ACFFNY_16735 [Paenibacillus hodogayensis]|uniref:HYR domain-containing protein n=1 Tax=Paenibacillus hodogayensis TaxID=279208 RepID=A0ABV5VYJ7_9BACL